MIFGVRSSKVAVKRPNFWCQDRSLGSTLSFWWTCCNISRSLALFWLLWVNQFLVSQLRQNFWCQKWCSEHKFWCQDQVDRSLNKSKFLVSDPVLQNSFFEIFVFGPRKWQSKDQTFGVQDPVLEGSTKSFWCSAGLKEAVQRPTFGCQDRF